MGDYGRGVEIGPQVPQKEFKGYNIWSEVVIPILQALVVIIAVDLVAGLFLYLAIRAGPQFWRFAIGLVLLGGTAAQAFSRPGDERRLVLVLLSGSVLLVAQQVGLVKLTPVWPWGWRGEAWLYTSWIGPFTGLGVLIWRFVNEVRDPWWPRLQQGASAEPPPSQAEGHEQPVTVRVEVAENNGRKTQFLDLTTDTGKLVIFAKAILSGRGLTVNNWAGAGRLFSRSEFEQLRNDLLERRLLRWVSGKDPRQGVELSPAGAAVFRRLVAELDNLSPAAGDNDGCV